MRQGGGKGKSAEAGLPAERVQGCFMAGMTAAAAGEELR